MNNAFSQIKLNHIAVYVENIEESGAFYREVLGLEETEEPFKDGLHLWFNLGKITLHLIAGLSENLIFKKRNHLCLSVADMDGFMDRLKEAGIPFESSKGVKQAANVRPDGIRQIYLQDPTGYWIEINDDY